MFDYQTAKDGKVFIVWNGKHVVTLAGQKAAVFMDDIKGADDADAQLLMARVTGNFRRGNERLGKNSRRNGQ